MGKKTTRQIHPLWLALGAWLCPGAGHYLLEKRYRAAFFFVAVGVLFWTGILLKAYFTYPNTPGESFALFKFLGGLASGAHFILALLLGQGGGDLDVLKASLSNEYGNTCLFTAGILNVLMVVDALNIQAGRSK